MAGFDTGYVNTTFYGVSYGIRVAGAADRNDGSTSVRFHGTCFEKQNTNTYNFDSHNVSIGGLLGNGQIKPSGAGYINNVWTRGFDTTQSIGIGTTSRGFTATWSGGGNTRSIGFTASFNDGYSSPTGLGINSISATHNSITANVYISGWGHTGSSTKYRELTVSAANNNIANRRFQPVHGSSLSGNITTTNSSSQSGSMTISPNTRYYLAGYATNGSRSTGVQFFTSKITQATGSFSLSLRTSSSIRFNVSATGGASNPTVRIRYRSYNSSSWTTHSVSVAGTSGQITVTGLAPSNKYVFQIMVSNVSGTWYGGTITTGTTGSGSYSSTRVRPNKLNYSTVMNFGNVSSTCKIQYRVKGTSTWLNSSTVSSGTGSVEIAGLKQSTVYQTRLAVINYYGTWYSAISEKKTKPGSIMILPDGTKRYIMFKIIYPNNTKRSIERWKKIT